MASPLAVLAGGTHGDRGFNSDDAGAVSRICTHHRRAGTQSVQPPCQYVASEGTKFRAIRLSQEHASRSWCWPATCCLSGMARDASKLTVFTGAHEVALQIYHITAHMPASETFGLRSQLRRAAISVPTNIVEGVPDRVQRTTSA